MPDQESYQGWHVHLMACAATMPWSVQPQAAVQQSVQHVLAQAWTTAAQIWKYDPRPHTREEMAEAWMVYFH